MYRDFTELVMQVVMWSVSPVPSEVLSRPRSTQRVWRVLATLEPAMYPDEITAEVCHAPRAAGAAEAAMRASARPRASRSARAGAGGDFRLRRDRGRLVDAYECLRLPPKDTLGRRAEQEDGGAMHNDDLGLDRAGGFIDVQRVVCRVSVRAQAPSRHGRALRFAALPRARGCRAPAPRSPSGSPPATSANVETPGSCEVVDVMRSRLKSPARGAPSQDGGLPA
jgi:hypothetical protein